MDFFEWEEQHPAYNNKKSEIDYYELYGNLRKQIEDLASLTETLAESTENGSVILINYKLQHIINNQ